MTTYKSYVYDGSNWKQMGYELQNEATIVYQATAPVNPAVGTIWLDTSQQAVTYDTTVPTGFRNVIINGNMSVWQRGTSTVYVQYDGYRADRWGAAHYQSANYVRQQLAGTGDIPPSPHVLRVGSCTNAQDANGSRGVAAQQIESANVYPLRNKQVTLSFYARFSAATQTAAAGNWRFIILADSGVDLDFGTGGPATSVATVTIVNGSRPTTWTRYSVTGTIPSNAATIRVDARWESLFKTTNAYDDWYEIACVQLEEGSTATPFEVRPYGTELALCQRYYYETGGTPYAPLGVAATETTTTGRLYVPFPVTMRTSPVFGKSGSNPIYFPGTYSNLAGDRYTTNAALLTVTATTGFLASGASFVTGNSDGTTTIYFNAEL